MRITVFYCYLGALNQFDTSFYELRESFAAEHAVLKECEVDDVRTTLADDETQKTMHSYTVVGKVLIADLLDSDKFQNHFLLTAAALGSQLLNTYGFGKDAEGNNVELTVEKISKFFFDILSGVIVVQPLSGTMSISQIMRE